MAGRYTIGDTPVPGYRLQRFLGKGGFGEVWEVAAPGGTRCALKIIPLHGREGKREFRAIRLVKHLRHPNLCPLHALWLKDQHGAVLEDEFFESDDLRTSVAWTPPPEDPDAEDRQRPSELIIAMGLGEQSLYDVLREYNKQSQAGVPAPQLLDYLEDAARAIDYLNAPRHDLGWGPTSIEHCDIKPQNLLLVGDSTQVCDFGLARALSGHNVHATMGGGVAASPAYASPEAFSARGPGAGSDQYSLAISYYELRTGHLPFPDDYALVDVMRAHVSGRLDFGRIPAQEQAVLRKATSLRAEDRFASAVKFVRAMRQVVDEESAPLRTSITLHVDTLGPGREVGLGYVLKACLIPGDDEQVWTAMAPGGRAVGMLIRDLRRGRETIDFQALDLLRSPELEHPNLSEIQAFWVVDQIGHCVTVDFESNLSAQQPAKFFMAGKLATKTLRDRLNDCRASGAGMPWEEMLGILSQLADAIDFLSRREHQLGSRTVAIQHLNVRPENILIIGGEGVRLGNFTYARVLSGDELSFTNSSWIPSHPFVAPEVQLGRLTRWSDQYSLALVFIHMRLGRVPMTNAGAMTQFVEQVLSAPEPMRGLNAAEIAIVRRATSLDPASRFPDCKLFVQALVDARDEALKGTRQTALQSGPAQYQPLPPAAGQANLWRDTQSPSDTATPFDPGRSPAAVNPLDASRGTLMPPGFGFDPTSSNHPLPPAQQDTGHWNSPAVTETSAMPHIDEMPELGDIEPSTAMPGGPAGSMPTPTSVGAPRGSVSDTSYTSTKSVAHLQQTAEMPADLTNTATPHISPTGPSHAPAGGAAPIASLPPPRSAGGMAASDLSGTISPGGTLVPGGSIGPAASVAPRSVPLLRDSGPMMPQPLSHEVPAVPARPPVDVSKWIGIVLVIVSIGVGLWAAIDPYPRRIIVSLLNNRPGPDPTSVPTFDASGPLTTAATSSTAAATTPLVVPTSEPTLPPLRTPHEQAADRLAAKEFEVAAAQYRALTELDAQDVVAWHGLALSAAGLQDWDEAIAAFDKTAALDPENKRGWHADPQRLAALLARAKIRTKAGDAKLATLDLDQLIALAPDDGEAHLLRGTFRLEQQAYPAAIEDFNVAVRQMPTEPRAFSRRGFAYMQLREQEPAIDDLTQAIKLDPNAIDFLNRGIVYVRVKNWDDALADLTQAIGLAPQLADPYYYRGEVHRSASRFPEAIADYGQAIERRANFTGARLARGVLYLATEKPAEAADDFTVAIRDSGIEGASLANLHRLRGDAFEKSGREDYARADRWLAKEWMIVAGAPKDASALAKIALFLATCDEPPFRDPKRAKLLATSAVEITREKDAEALDALAAVIAATGDYDQAAELAAKAVALANGELRPQIETRLTLYRDQKPATSKLSEWLEQFDPQPASKEAGAAAGSATKGGNVSRLFIEPRTF